MATSRPPLVVIAGPTASGKSALAIELARRTGGVIVNADSAQLYRDLPILSAMPTAADQAAAEHRLFGIRDGAKPCSAAEWATMARTEINAVHGEGRLPILVGGTGLYIRTLLDGIAPVPPIDPAVRAEVRGTSVADNLTQLASLDRESAARLNPGDTTRIARALEVVRSSGVPLGRWQERKSAGLGESVALRPLILLPPRDWLTARCATRFAAMIDAGAQSEAEALACRHLDPHLPVMRAIGLAEVLALSRGDVDRATAKASGTQATRRYAKRQYTWFAHQPPAEWPRFATPLDELGAIDTALALLGAAS